MRLGRSHPIFTAAVIGAAVGFLYAIAVEIAGVLQNTRHAGVLTLLPGSIAHSGMSESTLIGTVLLLFIEFAANVLVYAAMFALPVALVVAVRRLAGIGRIGKD
jgi:hypothetical protein